jgi:hypothetical protein
MGKGSGLNKRELRYWLWFKGRLEMGKKSSSWALDDKSKGIQMEKNTRLSGKRFFMFLARLGLIRIGEIMNQLQ